MVIKKENVRKLTGNGYINLYELEYAPGKVYYDASRRDTEDLMAVKTDEEFADMIPDAVTVFPILITEYGPRLLLSYEYRYPAGRFLLSPPAGLIDRSDMESKDPVVTSAVRELYEETGLFVYPDDRIIRINPLAISTPGMSDESNALVAIIFNEPDMSLLSQDNAEGTELFNGFELVSMNDAEKLIKDGRDKNGNYYSLYTWAALMYFVSGRWELNE